VALEALIDPSLRSSLHGETDSERCFLLFLTRLRRRCPVEEAEADPAAAALAETVALVRKVVDNEAPGSGLRAPASPTDLERASTTFLATDGRVLIACRSGRTLYISSPEPDADGRCEYVALASEDPGEPPPGGTRAWRLLPEESLVAVDAELRVKVTSLPP
jgi:glutamine amidotransferase